MTRLLHAAARGARIEEANLLQTEWTCSHVAYLGDVPWQRIHPDDEHLQYGPISTALRDHMQSYELGAMDMPPLAIHSAIYTGYADKMMK